MTQDSNTELDTQLTAGIDPASFSSVTLPADDLFRYVNGPWIDTYCLPDDRSRYGSFDRLAENAESQIRDILESNVAANDSDSDDQPWPATKSKALYQSFLDVAAIDAAGVNAIKPSLDAVDQASSKEELVDVLGTLSPAGGPDLIDFAIYGDPKDPDHNILHIEQSGLGLPDEAYYRDDHYEPIRREYVAMVARQLINAGYFTQENESEATDVAERYLSIETTIAKSHWDNVTTRDPQKTYNPYDFDKLAATLADFNIVRWADAAQKAYDGSVASQSLPVDVRGTLEHTIVHEPSFLEGLNAFWKDADLEDLKLWARVHVIIGSASMLDESFDKTNFEFYGKTLSGTKQQRDRWKRGVSLVNGICGEDVGREYVRRHFPQSSKDRMEELVHNLIEAYHVSILNSVWLGDETKQKALDKLDHFSAKIGYTDHWRDYTALDVSADKGLVENMAAASLYEFGYQMSKCGKPVDKDEWLMNPQTVNAYYEPSLNIIVFPAAILQPPFFNPDAEDAANYGGIGAVIGHEIGHGFDDQGSQFDGDGKLNDWWTADDKARFQELTQALINQYNTFVPAQLQDKYAAEGKADEAPHVNGALTVGENIGDLSGVNIALKAYAFALDKAASRDIDGSPEAIEAALDEAPVIDGFTGLQRFFLSYASIWRSKNRDELAEQYLQIDPHSPAESRVNGIARNVDLFYHAFDVKPENGMWLAEGERVHIW